MTIIYIDTNWKFNEREFAVDVLTARLDAGLTQREVDVLIGREGTCANVEGPRKNYEPYISTLLLLCNLFDLDPRKYWEVV